MTKALLESVLATLEGRSAPRDPIQVWAAAPSLSQPGPAAASPVAPLLSHTMCRGIETLLVAPLQVVDAFAVPRVQYDPVRKLFHRSTAVPQLQADAQVGAARLRQLRQCRALSPVCKRVEEMYKDGKKQLLLMPLLMLLMPLLLMPLSPPQSKVALYVNRFYLVLQRLKRNKLFRPAQVGSRERQGWCS